MSGLARWQVEQRAEDGKRHSEHIDPPSPQINHVPRIQPIEVLNELRSDLAGNAGGKIPMQPSECVHLRDERVRSAVRTTIGIGHERNELANCIVVVMKV